jgi:uncharacterized protein YkwD
MDKRYLALALLLSACGKPSGLTAAAEAPSSAERALPPGRETPAVPLAKVDEAIAVANDIRRQNGLTAFATDPLLNAVAQAHAEDMLRRHFFDHDTPEGVTPFRRMELAGVSFRAAAENIAMGTTDPRKVFDMWLASPGHRRNLLNKTYGRHGVGFAGGYWVHDFAD